MVFYWWGVMASNCRLTISHPDIYGLKIWVIFGISSMSHQIEAGAVIFLVGHLLNGELMTMHLYLE